MRTLLAILAMLIVITGSAGAEDLNKLSLDDSSLIGTKIETDGEIKPQGKARSRLQPNGRLRICLGEVAGVAIENAKLVYKAKVKSALDGTAFLESGRMWVAVNIFPELFLTQDEDFVEAAPDCKASIIWSRVTQSMPFDQRVEIWLNAVRQFFSKQWSEKFFELLDGTAPCHRSRKAIAGHPSQKHRFRSHRDAWL